MKFVVVNGRTPRQQTRCALCCEPIGKSYLRELTCAAKTAWPRLSSRRRGPTGAAAR
jgi:hypothetical protein